MASHAKRWTLDEVHSLPDDGNKYELVRGDLFVTPPPSPEHETILARLSALLVPYVAEQRLGRVFHPRAVVRFEGSEVEPDLTVRTDFTNWDDAPPPILVVEVLSDSTRRRDNLQKREFYLDAGVIEYWIVDPDRRTMRIVRAGADDETATFEYVWNPPAAGRALAVPIPELFGG